MKKQLLFIIFLISTQLAFASGGHFEDSLANIISWLVLLVLPFGGIYLFWKAHIYPEVLAEKNNHPQLQAIKTMCLLSLFVGGLLWPIALIWANYKYPEKDFPEENESTSPVVSKEKEPLKEQKSVSGNVENLSEDSLES